MNLRSNPRKPARPGGVHASPGTFSPKEYPMQSRHPMQSPARAGQQGMTLIEILVVLVLIGLVLGIVGGNYLGRGEKAKADAARIEIGQIGQTLDLYKLETGRYPSTQEGLQALVQNPSGVSNWNGPYWKKSTLPKDPWGNEYLYASPGQNTPYDIMSHGSDGREGGEGPAKDISSAQ